MCGGGTTQPNRLPCLTRLEQLKRAIATQEGFFRPGTVPARLHNPGDLMFAHQHGSQPCDIHGKDGKVRTYAEFPDDTHGWAALEAQIRLDAARGLTAFVMKAIGVTDPNMRLAAVIV